MGTISEKLTYLNDTKGLLKDSINSLGGEITSQTTFRQYATELDNIYASLPKVSGTGTSISLSPTRKGRIGNVPKGNTIQNGTPSPSSSVAIQSTTGLQNIKIEGKNLVNINDFTVQANTNFNQRIGEVYLEEGTTYYYSYTQENNLTNNTRNTPFFNFSGTNTYQSTSSNYNLTAGRKVWEYTPSVSGTYNVGFWCHTPSNDVKYSDIMISTLSDTTYEPYQTPQTKPLNLGNIKLNKIGNYQDYITGTPNNWSIVYKIGNKTLNGSESWTLGTNRTKTISCNTTLDNSYASGADNGNGYTNYFIGNSNGADNDINCFWFNPSGGFRIRIEKSNLSEASVDGFKSWLSTHNTEVDYILATPTTEPITNTELITQLNALYYANSYNGTTNISVEGDLPMILDVSALKGEE